MSYKVFISHSTQDQGLVVALSNLLTKFKIDVFVAEWYIKPGEVISSKINEHIKNSDCIIALLSKNGIRSNYVHQEIGMAIKSNKLIIPLVEKGIDKKSLAAIGDKKYIEYDPYNPGKSLEEATEYLNSSKLDKEQKEKNLIVVGGIIAFFLLLSEGKK